MDSKRAQHPALLALLPFVVVAVAFCSPSAVPTEDVQGSPFTTPSDDAGARPRESGPGVAPRPVGCAVDAAPYDEAKMRADLTYLASPELAGRAPGTPGDAAARAFIEERFRCLGVKPGGDDGTYLQKFVDSEGTTSYNVVGMIPGTDPVVGSDIIVLGAHIDHFGTLEGEGLRLGANDNASGITSVLTVAQAIKQRAKAPRRTVAFMLFGSEELGCEGSHHYVDHSLKALPTSRVVYDINFDMVGSYAQNGGKVIAHGTVAKTPGAAVLAKLLGGAPGLNVETGVPGIEEDDSDYYPFCAAGIPMVGFFTDDPPCYHKACDTADKIDYPHLAQIAKLGGDLALGLADGSTDLAAFRRTAKASSLGCEGYDDGSDEDDDD
jgi:hypothetical protein